MRRNGVGFGFNFSNIFYGAIFGVDVVDKCYSRVTALLSNVALVCFAKTSHVTFNIQSECSFHLYTFTTR